MKYHLPIHSQSFPLISPHSLLLLFFIFQFSFFTSVHAQRPKNPTVISVGDLLYNYGLDTTIVNDSSAAIRYLESLPQDYVELTNLCVSLRTKAQTAIKSFNNDYTQQDGIIWIDSSTVVADFGIYEYRLRLFANFMGRRSISYSRLEQERVEREREEQRIKDSIAAEELQKARNKQADNLRISIAQHDQSIDQICRDKNVSDKDKAQELLNIFYAYKAVYNDYDLSPTQAATPALLDQLDELNSFQNDLLENVLGNNNLRDQIDNFKNQLKVRCEKDHNEVFRSYSKVFKKTSVPVTFTTLAEYHDYISRLQTVIAVQQRYVQTVELRNTIATNYDAISNLYAKKYKPIFSAYKEVHRTVDQVPAFTTNAQSLNFIQSLTDYVEAQQLYQEFFPIFEDITRRSDTILEGRHENFKDVSRAYRDLQSALIPLPTFKTPTEAVYYEQQLSQVTQVQNSYLRTIDLRTTIQHLDDSLEDNRKTDRTLWDGYKLLRKQMDFTPSFNTVERARSFLTTLDDFVALQRFCLRILDKRREIETRGKQVEQRASNNRNISKAYSRMKKAYDDFDEIANQEDFRRYDRQCDRILEMQQAFLRVLDSEDVLTVEKQLYKESDIAKIKILLGLN